MLRLPVFRYHRPDSLASAIDLLGEHGASALPVAGGTDLIPNMKHHLFEPKHLVGLSAIAELRSIEVGSGWLVLGSGVSLAQVASHEAVLEHAPALAEAARHVAGPQLRNRGTIGGNLCLETRCTYYNQTAFWREALGFCLKKDGEVCHVTGVGRKCVAAHSADTPPVLMVLRAEVELAGPQGARSMPISEFFVADGIRNTRREAGELVTRIRIPLPGPGGRAAYAKLRQRGSIDFPLLTVAVGVSAQPDGTVADLRGVVTALGSRPRELSGWNEMASGEVLNDDLVEALALRAYEQCHPLENLVVDPEWRRAMVPVYIRRALDRLRDPAPGTLSG